jgi:predicted Rossmann fold nucleotide-binding protein DprA/Smf involved in DNA uptake
MKVIIAGCRSVTPGLAAVFLLEAIEASGWAGRITEVVSGCARGIDAAGDAYALEHGIRVSYFPADWRRDGRAAGPIRNRKMAAYADALLAVWDKKSRGTKNMIDEARRARLDVYVHRIDTGMKAR